MQLLHRMSSHTSGVPRARWARAERRTADGQRAGIGTGCGRGTRAGVPPRCCTHVTVDVIGHARSPTRQQRRVTAEQQRQHDASPDATGELASILHGDYHTARIDVRCVISGSDDSLDATHATSLRAAAYVPCDVVIVRSVAVAHACDAHTRLVHLARSLLRLLCGRYDYALPTYRVYCNGAARMHECMHRGTNVRAVPAGLPRVWLAAPS
jgi:hypothetical protein